VRYWWLNVITHNRHPKETINMALRINRNRSHEISSKPCDLCALWGIKRFAKWIGQYNDGKRVLICDGCKSSGFKVIGEYFEVGDAKRYIYRTGRIGVRHEIYGTDKSVHDCSSRADAMDVIRWMIHNGVAIDDMFKFDKRRNKLMRIGITQRAATIKIAMDFDA
jgi:hypothetical protein